MRVESQTFSMSYWINDNKKKCAISLVALSIIFTVCTVISMWNLYQGLSILFSFGAVLPLSFIYGFHLLKNKKKDPIQNLPAELGVQIFSYLDTADKLSCLKVSKLWNQVASIDLLWKEEIFDGKEWEKHIDIEKYGLSFEDESPLDKEKYISLINENFLDISIKNNAGITCITIPKGLSAKKIVKIMKEVHESDNINFLDKSCHYIFDGEWKDNSHWGKGEVEIPHTYKILISNDVLENDSISKEEDTRKIRELMKKDFDAKDPNICYLTEILAFFLVRMFFQKKRAQKILYIYCWQEFANGKAPVRVSCHFNSFATYSYPEGINNYKFSTLEKEDMWRIDKNTMGKMKLVRF